MEEKMLQKDALMEKLRLKNRTIRGHIKKASAKPMHPLAASMYGNRAKRARMRTQRG
jgi:hypothetical protein